MFMNLNIVYNFRGCTLPKLNRNSVLNRKEHVLVRNINVHGNNSIKVIKALKYKNYLLEKISLKTGQVTACDFISTVWILIRSLPAAWVVFIRFCVYVCVCVCMRMRVKEREARLHAKHSGESADRSKWLHEELQIEVRKRISPLILWILPLTRISFEYIYVKRFLDLFTRGFLYQKWW